MALQVYFGTKKVDGEHSLSYDQIFDQLRITIPATKSLYTILMTHSDITAPEALGIEALTINVSGLQGDRLRPGQVIKEYNPNQAVAWSQRYHGIHSVYLLAQTEFLTGINSASSLLGIYSDGGYFSAIDALCQRRRLTQVAVVNYWLGDKAVCW